MTIGDLKALLAETTLPDHAPVYITGRHSFLETEAEETYCAEANQYGQAQFSVALEREGEPNALLFKDRSRG